jgi:hypothetical protein
MSPGRFEDSRLIQTALQVKTNVQIILGMFDAS